MRKNDFLIHALHPMKKLIYFLLSTCVINVFSVLAQDPLKDFAGGEGTKESPYLIESASQLSRVRNYTGEGFSGIYFKMTQDIEFTKTDFESKGEFYNKGKGWEPIGNEQQKFEGIFDGGGKTIKGLISCDRETMGLFGVTRKGVIKNVSLIGCEYFFQNGKFKICVGGIVSDLNESIVDHCRFIGKITIRNEEYSRIGGIVGNLTSGDGEIRCCFARAEIKAESLSKSAIDAGGIVGSISDGVGLKDCYADVTIICSGNGSVGGIAGMASCYYSGCSIVRCYVKGNISVGSNVGGIIGGVAGPYAVSNNFAALKTIIRKKNSEFGNAVGRVVGWVYVPKIIKNNYVFPAMVIRGKPEKVEDSLNSRDGIRSHDYEKKEFWESLGFVFGNTSDAPWVFTKGFPILYGFEEDMRPVVVKEERVVDSSENGGAFQSMRKVYESECDKLKKGAESNRTLFINELVSSYDTLLSKELNRIGDTNLELAAAIQFEQGKLKQPDSYSFTNTGGIPEISKLRKPLGERLTLFEKENEGKLKRAQEALDLKYMKALSALQKKSTQNKEYAQALQIKKEIDRLIKGSSSSEEWVFE